MWEVQQVLAALLRMYCEHQMHGAAAAEVVLLPHCGVEAVADGELLEALQACTSAQV